MKTVLYIIIAGFIFYSCEQKNAAENVETNESIEKEASDDQPSGEKKENQEPKISTATNATDTIPIHIFKTGETLWDLCRTYYGNRHYSSIIATYNEIENVSNIKNGAAIKIPLLVNLLSDPKLRLDPIHNEIEKILQARALFMKQEKMLFNLRKDVKGRTPINLPEDTKKDIQTAAILIEESITSLGSVGSDSIDVPVKTISQLKSLVLNLNNLSLGNHDGSYGYDLDMFHQRLIHAINNSIIWAKNNYK